MDTLIIAAYLVASVLFVIGIKMLGRVRSARRGNLLSGIGMLVAIVATVLKMDIITPIDLLISMVIGGTIGILIAYKVKMTKIPEIVALFNGFGGLASLTVAMGDYWYNAIDKIETIDAITGVSVAISVLIGGLTFTGSIVAYLKLDGKISGRAIVFKGQHLINLTLGLIGVGLIVLGMMNIMDPTYFIALAVIALILGVLVVIPIGGADMPVVISLLNSYSGMAACATGFVIGNEVLIVAGALVGAAGLILTQIMAKAMNRSLANILLGGFGQTSADGDGGDDGSDIVIKEVGVEEAAMIFDAVSSLIIVPGYGMAVAQAQHVVRELAEVCEEKGIEVRFAIHPVAGRMPGHMNVLLAEANVPYDKLIEMDHINNDFASTDLVFVVGANDVVNPAAKTNPASPIYGMPVLNVEDAQTVIVNKRSMAVGYAGIQNELFGEDNCLMLFGDAKDAITRLVTEIKDL